MHLAQQTHSTAAHLLGLQCSRRASTPSAACVSMFSFCKTNLRSRMTLPPTAESDEVRLNTAVMNRTSRHYSRSLTVRLLIELQLEVLNAVQAYIM